jgi:uncharacterized protein YlxW (UPF0749 family)
MKNTMNKSIPALLAAFVMTFVIGVAILAVGGNALLNSNGVSISNSPAAASSSVSADQSAQIQDLQNQIAQYQAREAQYQTQLNQAADRIRTDEAQMQQFQMVLLALQQRGLITIDDGRIFINQ